MASFAGHLETQEAATKLQQLSKKIDNLKLQVYDITVNKYANFVPKLHSTEQLVSDVAAIKEEMDEVSSKIENEVCIYIYMYSQPFVHLWILPSGLI